MRHIIRQRIRKKVIVTTKSGAAFRGVLFACDSEALLLRNAEHEMGEAGLMAPVDGEVLILRADVAFVQLP